MMLSFGEILANIFVCMYIFTTRFLFRTTDVYIIAVVLGFSCVSVLLALSALQTLNDLHGAYIMMCGVICVCFKATLLLCLVVFGVFKSVSMNVCTIRKLVIHLGPSKLYLARCKSFGEAKSELIILFLLKHYVTCSLNELLNKLCKASSLLIPFSQSLKYICLPQAFCSLLFANTHSLFSIYSPKPNQFAVSLRHLRRCVEFFARKTHPCHRGVSSKL